ncbi:hypothetical protein M5K25_019467 [Dendrobium thyrsiflorum]|uniref:Uncharacterized protein n=1 Tax=Dendrobium thyrsiflorum TaxID=117978 RepID=A0ABD0UF86_DENTH
MQHQAMLDIEAALTQTVEELHAVEAKYQTLNEIVAQLRDLQAQNIHPSSPHKRFHHTQLSRFIGIALLVCACLRKNYGGVSNEFSSTEISFQSQI